MSIVALALTADQEEYWPAIAAELRALGKVLKANAKHNGGKISVDQDTIQRLYWAAAPLITRLSYEQKTKVKQMARPMFDAPPVTRTSTFFTPFGPVKLAA